ncbi:MAG: N-acetylmuramoyl-L-alanine amidase [Rhodothermales bacterium]|nr:N-acetylmuramoyl-L-alanine amidase [Rhodothermales bacterium]
MKSYFVACCTALLFSACASGGEATSGLDAVPTDRNTLIERVSFEPRPDNLGVVVRIHADNPVSSTSPIRWTGPGTMEFSLAGAGLHHRYRTDLAKSPVSEYTLTESPTGIDVRLTFAREDVDARIKGDPVSNDVLLAVGITTGGIASTIAAAIRNANESPPPPDLSTVVSPTPGRWDREPAANPTGRWTLDTVVIDAGHGGEDEGAVGYGGVLEKDIVLPVSMKIGNELERRLGVEVIYTRTDDRFVPLAQRGHIANESGGKLFVSIHTNAAPDRRARGTETFFLGMHKTDAARNVMERENQVVELENDKTRYAEFDQSQLITQVLAQSAYMSHSQMLASLIQNEFDQRPENVNRGVKQAGFYVLWSASMPAVLVELGFLTNPKEAAWMRSEQGQAELAEAVVRAIESFETSYAGAIGAGPGTGGHNGAAAGRRD